MAFNFTPSSLALQIFEFLQQVSISNWRVHSKIVEFNDVEDRKKKMTLLRNKLIAKGLPEAAANEQAEELKDADTLSWGIKSLKQKGSIVMCCGDWEKDLQQAKSTTDALKHVVLVFLKEKQVSSYILCSILLFTDNPLT
jgi:hypothetical protein